MKTRNVPSLLLASLVALTACAAPTTPKIVSGGAGGQTFAGTPTARQIAPTPTSSVSKEVDRISIGDFQALLENSCKMFEIRSVFLFSRQSSQVLFVRCKGTKSNENQISPAEAMSFIRSFCAGKRDFEIQLEGAPLPFKYALECDWTPPVDQVKLLNERMDKIEARLGQPAADQIQLQKDLAQAQKDLLKFQKDLAESNKRLEESQKALDSLSLVVTLLTPATIEQSAFQVGNLEKAGSEIYISFFGDLPKGLNIFYVSMALNGEDIETMVFHGEPDSKTKLNWVGLNLPTTVGPHLLRFRFINLAYAKYVYLLP